MALVFRDAGAPPARVRPRVRPRGPLAHNQHPSFSWVRKWRVGLPGRGAPRERAHTGEVKGLPPSLLHGALLATLGVPGTLAPCSPAPSFVGCKPCWQGWSCPPQASPQASPWAQLTVCTGLTEMDGLPSPPKGSEDPAAGESPPGLCPGEKEGWRGVGGCRSPSLSLPLSCRGSDKGRTRQRVRPLLAQK